MQADVNPAFEAWRNAPDTDKESALNELVKRMHGMARAICAQRIPEFEADFDALINGITWEVLRNAASFREEAKFSTWYYQIIVNSCNKFLRNMKRRQNTEPLEEEPPARNEALDARLDLQALLDGLEGQDHQLLRLVMEGEDFETIGTQLGVGRNYAQVLWHRLKRRLRSARRSA